MLLQHCQLPSSEAQNGRICEAVVPAALMAQHSPQKGASTGPVPKHAAPGHEPSTLHGSLAPLLPRDTQPLLEIVALV